MTQVLIRQCPICPAINSLTDQIFAAFRKNPNFIVMRLSGELDEFTILVDGESIPTSLNIRFLRSGEDLIAAIKRSSSMVAAL